MSIKQFDQAIKAKSAQPQDVLEARLGKAFALFDQKKAAEVQKELKLARSKPPATENPMLLILAYDDFVDEVQPLADWETLVGYPTLLVSLSTIGASPTAAQILTYIQGLYDAPEGLAWENQL